MVWQNYKPSAYSLIQLDESGGAYELRGGHGIPRVGAFRIELEDGSYIERTENDGKDFRLCVPTHTGFSKTSFRFATSDVGLEWSEEATAASELGAAPGQKQRQFRIGLPLPAFEILVSLVLFVLLAFHLLVQEKAFRHENPGDNWRDRYPPVDTSGEFVPDSKDPLPVRTE